MTNTFAILLETPWHEPQGFSEPTSDQWSGGVIVRMLACMSGTERSLQIREFYLMDPAQAERFIANGYARYVTEREIKCANAVGYKWPKNPGVKAPAPSKAKKRKRKSKSKAEDPAEEG